MRNSTLNLGVMLFREFKAVQDPQTEINPKIINKNNDKQIKFYFVEMKFLTLQKTREF